MRIKHNPTQNLKKVPVKQEPSIEEVLVEEEHETVAEEYKDIKIVYSKEEDKFMLIEE
jgi:hypothetical protein